MDEWIKCLRKLQESLRCPICLGDMRCPVLGHCGHAICFEHLPHIGADCPLCRRSGAFIEPVVCRSLQLLALAAIQQEQTLATETRHPPKCKRALKHVLDSARRRRMRSRLAGVIRSIHVEKIARCIDDNDCSAIYRVADDAEAREIVARLAERRGARYSYSAGKIFAFPGVDPGGSLIDIPVPGT